MRELVQGVAEFIEFCVEGGEEFGGGFEERVAGHGGADDLGVELDDVDVALSQCAGDVSDDTRAVVADEVEDEGFGFCGGDGAVG